jgi:phosphatidylinositol alpha-1,6-mannosyltransferase
MVDRSETLLNAGRAVGNFRDSSTADEVGVLVVSELFPPDIGGSAVLLHEIYRRQREFEVSVLTETKASPVHDEPQGLDIRRTGIRTPYWGLMPSRGLVQHFRLARAIRKLAREKGALVHCARALPEGVAAMMARQFGGPPYACWAHGEDIGTALVSRELTTVTKLVYGYAKAAIANSENTAGMLRQIGVDSNKIHVVHPGVDDTRFHPGVDGRRIRAGLAAPDEILLLSVGRLERRKGHDHVLDALAAARDMRPRLKYVIVGDGEERGRLQDIVRAHGLESVVTFAGKVDNVALPQYYSACDIFVLPNRDEGGSIEGFGIVFLEAAATGRPTIGGRTGGVSEAVKDEETGLLVSGTDVSELVRVVSRLSDHPALRERMGAAGRERVSREFSWERAAAQTQQVHRILLEHA